MTIENPVIEGLILIAGDLCCATVIATVAAVVRLVVSVLLVVRARTVRPSIVAIANISDVVFPLDLIQFGHKGVELWALLKLLLFRTRCHFLHLIGPIEWLSWPKVGLRGSIVGRMRLVEWLLRALVRHLRTVELLSWPEELRFWPMEPRSWSSESPESR